MNTGFIVGLSSLLGVLIGSLITLVGFFLSRRYEHKARLRTRELEHRVKEIDTINFFKSKIGEILHKHSVFLKDLSTYNVFDDVHITIDDYAYLESFVVINNYYLPNYVMEQFFKDITERKMVRTSQETLELGGYTFRRGRAVLENLSEELSQMVDEKKLELRELSNEPIHLLRKNEYSVYD